MTKSEYDEYESFTAFVDRVLSLPHSEIQKRVEAHRKAAAKNPHRRGLKPKRKRVVQLNVQ